MLSNFAGGDTRQSRDASQSPSIWWKQTYRRPSIDSPMDCCRHPSTQQKWPNRTRRETQRKTRPTPNAEPGNVQTRYSSPRA